MKVDRAKIASAIAPFTAATMKLTPYAPTKSLT